MFHLLDGNISKIKITPTKGNSIFELDVNSPTTEHVSKVSEQPDQNSTLMYASKVLTPEALSILDDILFSGTMPKFRRYIQSFEVPCNENTALVGEQVLNYCRQNILYITLSFVDIVLRGVSQVYLCDNPITGICICIGLLVTNSALCAYAIIGCIFSTLSACLMIHPTNLSELRSGLYGYDGTLVGGAVYTFLSISASSGMVAPSLTNTGLCIAAIMSCTAGIIHCSCVNMNNLPSLTLAFNIVVCGLFLSLARGMSGAATLSFLVDENVLVTSSVHDDIAWDPLTLNYVVSVCLKSIGQFCFVSTAVGGGFVWAGICIASRRAGCMALIGAIVAFIVARYVVDLPTSAYSLVKEGIYGYNAMGTCVAIGGEVFFTKGMGATGVAIIGCILTVFVQLAVASMLNTDDLSLPVLTIPFVVTTWLIMLTKSNHLLLKVVEVPENVNNSYEKNIEKIENGDIIKNDMGGSWSNGQSQAMGLASTEHMITSLNDSSSSKTVLTPEQKMDKVIYSELHDCSPNCAL